MGHDWHEKYEIPTKNGIKYEYQCRRCKKVRTVEVKVTDKDNEPRAPIKKSKSCAGIFLPFVFLFFVVVKILV